MANGLPASAKRQVTLDVMARSIADAFVAEGVDAFRADGQSSHLTSALHARCTLSSHAS